MQICLEMVLVLIMRCMLFVLQLSQTQITSEACFRSFFFSFPGCNKTCHGDVLHIYQVRNRTLCSGDIYTSTVEKITFYF